MEYKTLKFQMKLNKKELKLLRFLTHIAKNIYNVALYNLREEYFKTKRLLSFYELKNKVRLNPNFKLLEPYQGACLITNAIDALKLYTKYYEPNGELKKEYYNNEYAKNLSLPKYKKKESFQTIQFGNMKIEKDRKGKFFNLPLSYIVGDGRAFKMPFNDELINKFMAEAKLEGSQSLKIRIPRSICNKDLKQIKIVPREHGTIFEINYLFFDKVQIKMLNNKLEEDLAIDLGVSNLATCIITNNRAFIIDGRYLKSVLRLYNKKIGEAKSKLPKGNNSGRSKYIDRLYNNLTNKVNNYINVAVNKLINIAINNNVRKIIIGWSTGFKHQGIKNGYSKMFEATMNQSFIGIPLARFKTKIKEKSERLGIEVVEINESYTSKASFYDNDSFEGNNFSGERIERGLYKRKDGKLVNADLNGALNIYRKYINKGSYDDNKLNYLIGSGIPTPYRVRIL